MSMDVQAYVQAVLRESYEDLLDDLMHYADRVRSINAQKKMLREHLAELTKIRAQLAGREETDSIGQAGGSGDSDGSSPGAQSPDYPVVTSPQDRLEHYGDKHALVGRILELARDGDLKGRTTLEDRLLKNEGSIQDLIAAIPYMTVDEVKEVIAAFGGTDMKVKGELKPVWSQIAEALTPIQVMEIQLDPYHGNINLMTGKQIPVGVPYGPPRTVNTVNDEWVLAFTDARGNARGIMEVRTGTSGLSDAELLAAYRQSYASLAPAPDGPKNLPPFSLPPEFPIYELPGDFRNQHMVQVGAPQEAIETEPTTETPAESAAPIDLDPSDGSIDEVKLTENGLEPTGEKISTKAELDAHIRILEDELATVGDDSQLANVDLQNALQKQQQTLQTMSNVSKMLHDTAMAIIRKMGT